MGNRALVRALDEFAATAQGQLAVNEVVLAAPNIDAQVFAQLSQRFPKAAERITLYGSSNDKAIEASRAFHSFPRAGEGGAGLAVVPGFNSIDATAVDTSLLGHGYVGDNRTVIGDLRDVIRNRLEPKRRSAVQPGQRGSLPFSPFARYRGWDVTGP